MASSPAETPRAFALQELIACWNQGYAALAQGNLEQVAALLDIAAEHLVDASRADDTRVDTPAEAALRQEATAAYGRLQYGMNAGLVGLQEELSRARVGAKALRGYGNPSLRVGSRVVRDA
jgi:hypothetical protein